MFPLYYIGSSSMFPLYYIGSSMVSSHIDVLPIVKWFHFGHVKNGGPENGGHRKALGMGTICLTLWRRIHTMLHTALCM